MLLLLKRWRERWFVLRNVGGPTGQHFLEYYADEHCKKLKGRIDLDQCEQVDMNRRNFDMNCYFKI